MRYFEREYPLFSACGLNCGLCPRYHTQGASKCPGCSGKDFLSKHPTCGILSCGQRKGIEYCSACDEFPCVKYKGADKYDSFISHFNQLNDLEKLKIKGIDRYKNQLDQKIKILEYLLENHNDGRRKSFYCLAVNLMELDDILSVIEQSGLLLNGKETEKEKAKHMAAMLQDMAYKRNISLKLRKR